MCCTTLASVLTLAVLPDDDPVKILGRALALRKWRNGARKNACGSHIHILIVVFSNRENKTPQTDVVWNI